MGKETGREEDKQQRDEYLSGCKVKYATSRQSKSGKEDIGKLPDKQDKQARRTVRQSDNPGAGPAPHTLPPPCTCMRRATSNTRRLSAALFACSLCSCGCCFCCVDVHRRHRHRGFASFSTAVLFLTYYLLVSIFIFCTIMCLSAFIYVCVSFVLHLINRHSKGIVIECLII